MSYETPGQHSAASRFLSAAECASLAQRVADLTVGGGNLRLTIKSDWVANLRFARNRIISSGDTRQNDVLVLRERMGGEGGVFLNQIDETNLEAAVRRAEHLMNLQPQITDERLREHFVSPPTKEIELIQFHHFIDDEARAAAQRSLKNDPEPYATPKIFSDRTYELDAHARLDAIRPVLAAATKAGLTAAGYVQVSAAGQAVLETAGRVMYYPYTTAQFSVTVRDPKNSGSGWAGIDWNDWGRVDVPHLAEIAIDKCLRSRNPVVVEPGRYVTILEPQAVNDFCEFLWALMDRAISESNVRLGPFSRGGGRSLIGEKIIDARLSLGADPMDPDLGFPPFSRLFGSVYHPVQWIEQGVLKELPYYRPYGIQRLGKNTGLPNSRSYRMSVTGPTTSLDDMIVGTQRGVYVSQFAQVASIDSTSVLMTGFTRNGTWLIENGKITKAIKNFRFTESPLFMLNNVEQAGVPQRVFNPEYPAIYPALKVRDFNFSSLSEAV